MLVMVAVVIDSEVLPDLTRDYLQLKHRFFSGLMLNTGHYLDDIRTEIKGSDVRKNAIHGRRRVRRQAIGFLDHFLRLLEGHQVRVFGRIAVKPLAAAFDGTSLYTSSVQAICRDFQHHLTSINDHGLVIADSRRAHQNAAVSHSIFTQKFQSAGDRFDRLYEMPTFGHSDNHAGLQVSDLLCSALVYPIAACSYCAVHAAGHPHVHPGYADLKTRFGSTLRRLLYRYREAGRFCGGFTVSDYVNQLPSSRLL
jgi:hypothetical protein